MRYRLGRDSPEGFWRHAFNYARFHADVLEPLGPGGSCRYRAAAHDLRSDAVLEPEPRIAPSGAPRERAGILIDNSDVDDPRVLR